MASTAHNDWPVGRHRLEKLLSMEGGKKIFGFRITTYLRFMTGYKKHTMHTWNTASYDPGISRCIILSSQWRHQQDTIMAAIQYSFFRYINGNFGGNTVNTMKVYATNKRKHANLINRQSFSIRYRRQGIIPLQFTSSFKCVHELLAYVNKFDRTLNRF